MADEQMLARLHEVKKALDWANTTGSARTWWEAFETGNRHRLAGVLRLAEELEMRAVTITEFNEVCNQSGLSDIQANLYYLDGFRAKKKEERRKREKTASKARHQSGDTCFLEVGVRYMLDAEGNYVPVARIDGRKAPLPQVSDRTIRVRLAEMFPLLQYFRIFFRRQDRG